MDRDPINFFLDGEKNKNEGRKNLKGANKKKIQKISVKKNQSKAIGDGKGREPKLNEIYGIWDGCQLDGVAIAIRADSVDPVQPVPLQDAVNDPSPRQV